MKTLWRLFCCYGDELARSSSRMQERRSSSRSGQASSSVGGVELVERQSKHGASQGLARTLLRTCFLFD